MSVRCTDLSVSAIVVTETGVLATSKFTDSGTDAVHIARAHHRFKTLTAHQVALLRSSAACLLAGFATDAAITDATFKAIASDLARVGLRTMAGDTRPVSGTVTIVDAWLDTPVFFAHSVATTRVIVTTAALRLYTEARLNITDEGASAAFISDAWVHTDLGIIIADPSAVTIRADRAARAFSAPTIVATDPRARAVEVAFTWIITDAAGADPRSETINVGVAGVRLTAETTLIVTNLVTWTFHIGAPGATLAVRAQVTLGTLIRVIALSKTTTVTIVSAGDAFITVVVIAAWLSTEAKLAHSITDTVVVGAT